MINPLIGMPQGAEWIVILAIVILVFGAAKLPDLARSTGQALRIFKSETKALNDDDEKEPAPGPTPQPTRELPPVESTGTTGPAPGVTPEAAPGSTEGRSDRQPG